MTNKMAAEKNVNKIQVTKIDVRDIRFPTSLDENAPADAVHAKVDYSAAYVVVHTDGGLTGHGHSFTIGKGNDIVCVAARALAHLVIGRCVHDIYANFGQFMRTLTSESQLRWIGPEKGAIHLATSAILNALWDLRGKMEKKPVWKLLVDMTPEELVSLIDFRYLSDALTKEEALEMLRKMQSGKDTRVAELEKTGYPAYTTSPGWSGYTDAQIEKLCREAMDQGFTRFKLKVGISLENDIHRCEVFRRVIGNDKLLMSDANQAWDVDEAITWMRELARFNLLWIEEPTSPDDVLGHLAISKGLADVGIGVATGEHCQNKVMFKQFLKSGAMQFCQVDACRLASVNEILPIMLMAQKYGVPVVPHAGGVGLCELIQHITYFYYSCVSGTMDKRMLEYVAELHEFYVDPITIRNGHYIPPKLPGYSSEIKAEILDEYEYPAGPVWTKLIRDGTYDKTEI